jgi:hypothetical protein
VTCFQYFITHSARNPRSVLISQLLTGVVEWILKRNADFGKHPYMRKLVQDYLGALYGQNNGKAAVEDLVRKLHGPSSVCPHPRILPNLVTVCLASLHCAFTQNKLAESGSTLSLNAAGPSTSAAGMHTPVISINIIFNKKLVQSSVMILNEISHLQRT